MYQCQGKCLNNDNTINKINFTNIGAVRHLQVIRTDVLLSLTTADGRISFPIKKIFFHL